MESYQVIISGAGTAGCVLAARLSENPHRQVLLLEAGPDYPDPAALRPELVSSYRPAFSHDWDYHTAPDARGRTIHLPRARVVGGCSATNATFALRGSPVDYDDWATRGNLGWSYAEVLPWFRRLEHDLDFGGEWHGREGPVPIRRFRPGELTRVQQAFLEACSAAGFPLVEDHNAPEGIGAGSTPMNAIAGVRQSAALTHLAAARRRPNLTVLPGALVDRIVFQGRRAVGVRLAGPDRTVYAEQVILAAGSYGSPAVLLRSGDGPGEDLDRLGIPIVADRPGVGGNLADHPLVGLRYASGAPASVDPAPSFQTALTMRSTACSSGHDLQIFPMSAVPSEVNDGAGSSEFILFASLVTPRSRGRLRLTSADPTAPPRIDLGYFTHPDDLPRLLEAVRTVRSLAGTARLAELADRELFPGPGAWDSDATLEAALRAEVESYHHPVGTCRMGPAGEREAVVDARGKVHGLEGLYVVDASIMPTIPAANTNLPTLMLAERCAAWLAQ